MGKIIIKLITTRINAKTAHFKKVQRIVVIKLTDESSPTAKQNRGLIRPPKPNSKR